MILQNLSRQAIHLSNSLRAKTAAAVATLIFVVIPGGAAILHGIDSTAVVAATVAGVFIVVLAVAYATSPREGLSFELGGKDEKTVGAPDRLGWLVPEWGAGQYGRVFPTLLQSFLRQEVQTVVFPLASSRNLAWALSEMALPDEVVRSLLVKSFDDRMFVWQSSYSSSDRVFFGKGVLVNAVHRSDGGEEEEFIATPLMLERGGQEHGVVLITGKWSVGKSRFLAYLTESESFEIDETILDLRMEGLRPDLRSFLPLMEAWGESRPVSQTITERIRLFFRMSPELVMWAEGRRVLMGREAPWTVNSWGLRSRLVRTLLSFFRRK